VLELIRTLDPARASLQRGQCRLIEPDVAFVKQATNAVLFNDDDVPQLRLNPATRS